MVNKKGRPKGATGKSVPQMPVKTHPWMVKVKHGHTLLATHYCKDFAQVCDAIADEQTNENEVSSSYHVYDRKNCPSHPKGAIR